MKVDILGVQVDNLTFAQALLRVEEMIGEGRPHYVVTPYAESIVQARHDEEFRQILNNAALAVPDGISLLMAAKFLEVSGAYPPRKNPSGLTPSTRRVWESVGGPLVVLFNVVRVVRFLLLVLRIGFSAIFDRGYLDVIKEEVKGTDLMLALCERAAEKGWRVFLLGGWDGVAERAAERLKRQYSHIAIEYTAGCVNVKRESDAELVQVKERLHQCQPDLLFVSYGPVTQEKWIAKNLPHLSSKVVIGVAGAFDMLAGRKPRAPHFLRRCGLEWLWRLIIEPSRFPRIFKAVVVFPWLVFWKGLRG